ncbi:MAG TPA: pilus assembly protein N-terminal domain-containing protein [Pyrinomonadaceae bacterium]|nr:pilus assembly protein N-terminal domain-containing protein [Pyrinomonadaceae bacterium]
MTALFLACAAAECRAQTPDELFTIPRGQARTLPSERLAAASVGDINVIYIQGMKPGGVSLYAAGVGETTLELTRRDGRKTRLTVRVVPSERAAPPPTLPAAHATGAATPPPAATATPAAERVEPARPAPDEVAAQTAPPAPKPAPASTAAVRRERRSPLSRLELTVDTTYLSDRERVRVVSAELLDVKKLQEVVTADAEDKLAASPTREQTLTLRRSSAVTSFALSYDINGRDSLTVIVPYVRRKDEILVGDEAVKTEGRGLGDVQFRFERSFRRLFKTAWDGTAEFNLALPTGKSIYDAGEGRSPLGIGHYEVGGVWGGRRLFDPFLFDAAFGISYTVPRTVGGARVAPGLGYSAQTGFGYALSDRWVLSEQLGYTRRPNVFLSSAADARTVAVDQSSLSHGLAYRPRGGHVLHMKFNVGLNTASPDRGFTFSYAYRRAARGPE